MVGVVNCIALFYFLKHIKRVNKGSDSKYLKVVLYFINKELKRCGSSMKIREIMRDNSVYCLPDNTIFDVAKLMEKLRIAVMPIVVNEGLLGVITLRDIVENLQKNAVNGNMAASKLMKRNVYCCYEEDDLGFVAEKIGNLQVANLIVLNNEQNKAPTGVISLANLARHTFAAHHGRQKAEVRSPR